MKSRILSILKVGLLPALFIAPSLQAAPVIAEQILWDSTLNGGGNVIGYAVAIDGDWAFVGAPASDTENGKNYCQVYVYKFDYVTNLWGDGGLGVGSTVVTNTVTPDLPYAALRETGSCQTAEYGGFGASVSASNNLLAVGAPLAKSGGNIRGGKIFFYQYDPTQIANGTGGWVWDVDFGFPVQTDGITSDIQNGAAFGTVVSVRVNAGTTPETAILIGGAPLYDASNATIVDAGKVYVYEYTAGLTPGTGTVAFVNSIEGTIAGDQFGTSATSNGVNALVGAPLHDNTTTDTGAAYLYNITVGAANLLQTFTPSTTLDDHVGISVSLSPGTSDSVALIGGKNSTQHLYDGIGPYETLSFTNLSTLDGDVSQSGNIAGFGVIASHVALYYDKQDITGAPDWIYTLRGGEPDYGRDISITDNRVMVNGNGNTDPIVGSDGEGVAYAYYTASCYNGGELKANEWTMIGLQCDTSVASVVTPGSAATISEIFTDLGTYDLNWVMYKQNGTDYEGHQNAYTKLASSDVMVQGQGYWIIADVDTAWSMPPAIGDAAVQTARAVDSFAVGEPPIRGASVGAVFPTLELAAMLTGTTLPLSGDLTEDMRVMFSNPYIYPMTWGEALLVPQVGLAARVGDSTGLFENGDTSAYIYNPVTNGYTAVTSATPGFVSQIEPGQGFFVKFSDTFLDSVAGQIPVTTTMYLQLPLSK